MYNSLVNSNQGIWNMNTTALSYPSQESGAAQYDLEMLVDRWGLEMVLRMLSDVCSDKAAHLTENWQDTPAGKRWSRDADRIYKLAHKVATT